MDSLLFKFTVGLFTPEPVCNSYEPSACIFK